MSLGGGGCDTEEGGGHRLMPKDRGLSGGCEMRSPREEELLGKK